MASLDPDYCPNLCPKERLFVTYENATGPATAAELLQPGMDIPGIIYFSSATIPWNKFSGLARALKRLAMKIGSGEADPSGKIFLGGP